MKHFIFLVITILSFVSCQREEIGSGNNVDDIFFLQEKGNSMPIQVHGNLASNKMIFIIHGGPGGNAITYRDEYVKKNVEKEFAIIYWDQRLAGATQGNSSDTNIELFKADAKKVMQLIAKRYGADKKIYVMGHSWGGFLAPYFLEEGNNQNLCKGWIQVDGAHNYSKNDSLTREMLLFYGNREINSKKNISKWKEITDYCNAHMYNENFDVASKLNAFASKAEGYLDEVKSPKNGAFLSLLIENKIALTSQLSNLIISALVKKIDRQAYAVPISENLNMVKLPTLLLWGRHDFVCPIGLKDDIKRNIGSKDVSEKTFESSGHSPMVNEPDLFWKAVIDWVDIH